METTVEVFDPFTFNSPEESIKRPIEMPWRAFKQIIHWQDGDVLIIETQDEKDNLLHFYYENKTDLLSISLNENRRFLIADILPHQLRFKSRYEENRIRALKEFGIISRQVAYHVRADNHVFLRIGNLESGHYALINPKNYELTSLHNRIWLEDGSSIELKILFRKYVTYRWQEYAKVTEYYFDNKLFKRIKVSKIRTLSKLPIENFKKKVITLRKSNTANLKNDYSL